jgi:hypothetical protein
VEKANILTESKYIKTSRVIVAFPYVSAAFFFTLYVLPQYFGLPVPLFDFTVLRIMIILMFFFVLSIKDKKQQFFALVAKAPFSIVLIPYLLVLTYTMILRTDVNAFLNPAIELISFYLLIYVIQHGIGVNKTLRYILIFSYILASLGLIEYVLQRSPFSYLETIKGIYSGRFIRSGYYRIMGPSIHSLGYGLILITMVPIVCYDIEKEEINILKHKILFVMVALNIFFTGSRSTLSVFLLEVAMLALLSNRTNKKKLILIGGFFAAVCIAFLFVFQNTSVAKYILLQITSVLDELLGTTYSVKYGADIEALGSSSNYREQLKYIFQVDWLNPLVGLGRKKDFSCEINGSFIRSVDSFYIAEYIRYAYPGMICYLAFLFYFLIRMLKNCIRRKSQISKMLFIGSLCYCINIIWLDSNQTLKYLYILFAIFVSLQMNGSDGNKERGKKKLHSKYIK